eukprot:476273-Amphidinium_carterae.1
MLVGFGFQVEDRWQRTPLGTGFVSTAAATDNAVQQAEGRFHMQTLTFPSRLRVINEMVQYQQ